MARGSFARQVARIQREAEAARRRQIREQQAAARQAERMRAHAIKSARLRY